MNRNGMNIKSEKNNVVKQTDIFYFLHPRYKVNKPIRLIELFAGVGTFAMALHDLGADFKRHRVIEIDPFAMKSYNAIHDTNFEPTDIATVRAADLGITDKDKYEYIMTYSFPCQDLSKAGKQAGMSKDSGTRSGLLWEVERILLELKERNELPQVLVMENVPEVIGSKNKKVFDQWYASLERMRYQSYYKLLNAKDYGVPQSRNRCFMVSVFGNYSYSFPKPTLLEKRLCDVLETEVDEKYCVSDDTYVIQNGHGFNKGGMKKICPTITTGAFRENNFVYDQRIRKLTPLECWRLMDYTDEDFYKAQAVNSNTQLYKQAGNGIAKAVLIAILREILGK